MHNEKFTTLENYINQDYNYGFETQVLTENFPAGITEEIIRNLSRINNDPLFLQEFRLKSYNIWKTKKFPSWANLSIAPINYNNIQYYSRPKNYTKDTELPLEIEKTFTQLNLPFVEKKNKQVALDAVFDSVSVLTTYKETLAKHGVIFCSISEASQKFPMLVKKFLGTVVSKNDNFFAALNSAIFSDGSFCYIPKNVKCPLDLSTYFRINDKKAGQFERTLIVAEKNSFLNYLEGCTAIQFDSNQLHAAVVELIAFDNAEIRYSTVQNWYSGNTRGHGGIYNFVTKRGLCVGKNAKISWTQVETGSAITWKYPSCYLLGNSSCGEFYSIALTKNYQQADTGTKMLHIGTNTKSKVISKGISTGFSKNTYRGLVKFNSFATNAQNFSQCDSFLIGANSTAYTYPYLEIDNSNVKIEYEAKISKLTEEQLFYLSQRGFDMEKAIDLLIIGFCQTVLTKLPMEFSLEANKLLELKLEGGIG